MNCDYCHSDRVKLRRKIAGSGVVMYFWRCLACERHASKSKMWVSPLEVVSLLKTFGIEDLTVIPLEGDYSAGTRCVICDRPGAEFHHWAPQMLSDLFGEEWHRWPGALLCKEHHDQWHEIVTPFMAGRGKTETGRKAAERFTKGKAA